MCVQYCNTSNSTTRQPDPLLLRRRRHRRHLSISRLPIDRLHMPLWIDCTCLFGYSWHGTDLDFARYSESQFRVGVWPRAFSPSGVYQTAIAIAIASARRNMNSERCLLCQAAAAIVLTAPKKTHVESRSPRYRLSIQSLPTRVDLRLLLKG